MPSPLHEDFSDVAEIAPDVEGLDAARARSRARFDAQLAAAHPVTASRQGGGRGRAIIAAAAVAALLVAGGTTLLLTRDGKDTVKLEEADSSPTQSASTPGPSDPSQEPSVSGTTTGTNATDTPSASATGSATPTASSTSSPSVNISMPKPLGPATSAEWTTIDAPRNGSFSVTLAPGVPQKVRVGGVGNVPSGVKAVSVSIEYSKTPSASQVWAYAGGTKRPQQPTMQLDALPGGESALTESDQYVELGADGTVMLEADSATTITAHVARFQRDGNSNVFSFQSSGSSFDVASQLGSACLFSKDSVLCTLPDGVKLPPRPAKCDESTWGAFGILSTGRDPELQCAAGDPGFGEGMPIQSQRATIYGPNGLRCEVEGERLTCTAGGGRSMRIDPKGFQLVGKNGVVQSS